jgi:hypothetical protein
MEDLIYKAVVNCANYFTTTGGWKTGQVWEDFRTYRQMAEDVAKELTTMGYKIVPAEPPQEDKSLYADDHGE